MHINAAPCDILRIGAKLGADDILIDAKAFFMLWFSLAQGCLDLLVSNLLTCRLFVLLVYRLIEATVAACMFCV